MANLFRSGDFVLHSGGRSRWKIDCDALTDEDIKTLALMIAEMVGPFASVEGVPSGGLRLAKALQPLCTGQSFPHLIVDDVLTTGRSMRKAMEARVVTTHKMDCVGAVVFARGPCPAWIKALFQMRG